MPAGERATVRPREPRANSMPASALAGAPSDASDRISRSHDLHHPYPSSASFHLRSAHIYQPARCPFPARQARRLSRPSSNRSTAPARPFRSSLAWKVGPVETTFGRSRGSLEADIRRSLTRQVCRRDRRRARPRPHHRWCHARSVRRGRPLAVLCDGRSC